MSGQLVRGRLVVTRWGAQSPALSKGALHVDGGIVREVGPFDELRRRHPAAEEIGDGRTEFKCAPPVRERRNQDEQQGPEQEEVPPADVESDEARHDSLGAQPQLPKFPLPQGRLTLACCRTEDTAVHVFQFIGERTAAAAHHRLGRLQQRFQLIILRQPAVPHTAERRHPLR